MERMADDTIDLSLLSDELHNFQDIAKALQPSPGGIPELEGIQIAGRNLPLRGTIGGDHIIYVDFNKRFDLPARIRQAREEGRQEVADNLEESKRRAGVLLADVAGHRITDALVCGMLHQAFLIGINYELELYGEVTRRLFESINTRFYRSSGISKFLTMLYGEVTDRGDFRYIAAGHPPPCVFSSQFGRFAEIGPERAITAPPIGIFPSQDDVDLKRQDTAYGYKKSYTINEISLFGPGDLLLLSTDGLLEHGKGKFFPNEAEAVLRDNRDEDAETICSALEAAVGAYADPDDDISFVIIRKL